MGAQQWPRVDRSTTFTGSPETFQHDSIGTFTDSSFPTGWSDTAQGYPDLTAPQPSAVVIETTDAPITQPKRWRPFPT